MGSSARTRAQAEASGKLTAGQRRAIESDAARICVRAGPGSGKTRVLVERVAQRVAAKRLDLARTLAITFTENAAAEMKERLADTFDQRGMEEQRCAIERAYISTIHGFCARLLREHAVEARVDPQFVVLDEMHAEVLKQATLDTLLTERQRVDPTGFLETVRHLDRNYEAQLLGLYNAVCRLGCDPADRGLLTDDSALDELAKLQRERVAVLINDFHRHYEDAKQRLSALDFADLEHSTLAMLRGDVELARRISRRFQEILVDEYQDTSPVQSRIIQLLAADCRLFVVGDPAQSIYGFRNADPEGFEVAWKAAEPFGKDGQIDLREDFRSRQEILDAINAHFIRCFTEVATPFLPLECGSEFGAKEAPSVEVLLVGAEDEDDGKEDLLRLEAQLLAGRVRELVESGLKWRDVAMLFRSATDMKIYERALEDAGVPYFAEAGRGFYDAREVRDVISFLRVLDNSRNEVAVAAVLRSPMFGVSDDSLFLLADEAHRVSGRGLAEVLEKSSDEGVTEFQRLLDRLRRDRPWRTLAELIRDIVAATNYEAILLLEPAGRRKVANIRKLAEVAAALERAGFSTLRDFVTAVDRFHYQEVREAEAPLDVAGENAVRLMTMHAAKGLEFPVVVLPDLSRQPNFDHPSLAFDPENGIGVTVRVAGEKQKTPVLERIRANVNEREKAEEHRVLFVAMTRAQDHLLLSGRLSRRKTGFGASYALNGICKSLGIPTPKALDGTWRETKIGGRGTVVRYGAFGAQNASAEVSVSELSVGRRYAVALRSGQSLGLPVETQVETETRSLIACALAPVPAADAADFAASATDVLEFNSCPRRYFLGRYLGYDINHDAIHNGTPSRTELGLAAHRVLAVGREALATMTEPLRAQVALIAENFWASEHSRRIANGDVRRELPLIARIGDRFLTGTIDVLTLSGGRPGRPDLLLDYKANDITAAEVDASAEHYAIQMSLYALLVEAVYGAAPSEAVLYFLTPGVARAVPINPAALDAARSALDRLFEAQRTSSFPPVVAEHCMRCSFRGNLCLAPFV